MAGNYPDDAAFGDIQECSDADNVGAAADGELCDAEWTNTFTVTFVNGTFNCDPVEKTYTLTCHWDADGGLDQGRGGAPDTSSPTANRDNFLSCEIK